MTKDSDFIGRKFGLLTVESRYENTADGKRQWICVCDCGKHKTNPVRTSDLVSGKVRSCGCLFKICNKGKNTTHGLSKSRMFSIWSSMLARCRKHRNYVDRGITVCDEWLHDFQAFYDWAMGNGYEEHLTIDRIDNNRGYSPDNCRWVDMKTQQNNRRNNRIVNYFGVDFTIATLAQKINISPATLLWRVNKGWDQTEWHIEPKYDNKSRRRTL